MMASLEFFQRDSRIVTKMGTNVKKEKMSAIIGLYF